MVLDILSFKFYNHSMSTIFAKDQKEHLSLKKMVKAVKHDSVTFQSLAEPLTNGDFTVPSAIFDTFNILTIVSLCLWVCSILGIVYIIYNFRALTAALLLNTKATSVKASTIPVFRYRLEIVPPEDSTSTLLLLVQHFRKRHNCKILLEAASGSLCALVPVTFLSLCPSYLKITPPTDICNIQISGYIRPVLNLQTFLLFIFYKLNS